MTAADAFTILLPSVLTAAFVFDITAKKQRCQEWDRQIAAVEQETEQLRQAQLDAWSRIQHRSVTRGARIQRRYMSTAVAYSQTEHFTEELDPMQFESDIDAADKNAEVFTPDHEANEEDRTTQARFERLIATRLALQLMAQLRSSRTTMYTLNRNISSTDKSYSMSVDYLVSELDKIAVNLGSLKIHETPWGTMVPRNDRDRKDELGYRIQELTAKFRNQEVHLPEYITSFIQLVSEYKLGPPVRAYVDMMRAFSEFSENSSMAAMVETALWESHQILGSFAISNIIFRHGTDADASRMKEFLSRISKKDSFPRARHLWSQQQVNDVRITVPASTNTLVVANLARAALCCQQQTIAEAYATVFFSIASDPSKYGLSKWYLVGSFLQSYGDWGSWKIGLQWMHQAVVWLKDIYETTMVDNAVGRVILRMLDFCVACDRVDEYELVMEAALQSSITIPRLDPTKPVRISERMGQVRLDWIARSKQFNGSYVKLETLPANVEEFQNRIGNHFAPSEAVSSSIKKQKIQSSPAVRPIDNIPTASPQPTIEDKLTTYKSPFLDAQTERDMYNEPLDEISTSSRDPRMVSRAITALTPPFTKDFVGASKRSFSNSARTNFALFDDSPISSLNQEWVTPFATNSVDVSGSSSQPTKADLPTTDGEIDSSQHYHIGDTPIEPGEPKVRLCRGRFSWMRVKRGQRLSRSPPGV